MKRVRQYIGILAAAAAYYSVHEGAHLLCAVLLGTFKEIRFMGIGMQIDIYAERMTNGQMALFCIAGATATLLPDCSSLMVGSFGNGSFQFTKNPFQTRSPLEFI